MLPSSRLQVVDPRWSGVPPACQQSPQPVQTKTAKVEILAASRKTGNNPENNESEVTIEAISA
jgi:hypothetical protein